MHNAKQVERLAQCSDRAHVCTKYSSKGGFGYLGWGCLGCAMPNNVCQGLAWRSKRALPTLYTC